MRATLAHFRDIWQVIRYGLAGFSGVVLQAGFLYLFVDIAGLWYLFAVVPAFLLTLVIVFLIQKFWTFRERTLGLMHIQSLRYAAIAVVSLCLNLLGMYLLVDLFGVWYIVAQVMVALAVGLGSFLANKVFTFHLRPAPDTNEHHHSGPDL